MSKDVHIGGRPVGHEHPIYIIGEIGLNHNGDVQIAKRLVDAAVAAGCDAVKFQARTPEVCVPPEMRDVQRETPWGVMSYFEYRKRVEFGPAEYTEINRYCHQRDIHWFASCWDVPSVDFIEQFQPVCHKVASASLTDDALLMRIRATGRPIILSTGMSTIDEIDHAVAVLGRERLVLTHTTSTYPCKHHEINLRMIDTLRERFDVPVGYSGHEVGLQITCAAAARGACVIERHITLDRTMWGSDQAASVEPAGLTRLVRDIRIIEAALGDGVKRVYDSERPIQKKLRRVASRRAA